MTGRKAREECQKLDTDLPFSNQKKKTEILQTSCGNVENHGLEWKPLATIFLNGSMAHRYQPHFLHGKQENQTTLERRIVPTCTWTRKRKERGGNNPCMDAVYSVFCQKKKQNHRFLSLVTIDCKPDSRKYLLLVPN